jgi:hypothetical protein
VTQGRRPQLGGRWKASQLGRTSGRSGWAPLRALWPWLALLLLAAAWPRVSKAALRLEVAGGLALPDAGFADFRWDTGPQALVGGGLALEAGASALGVRIERHGGRQGTGLPGEPSSLALGLTSLEAVLGRRLAAPAGMEFWLQGHLGWLRLAYDPDRLTLTGAGPGGKDLRIDFAPVDELCGGGGLLLRRALASDLALGLDLDALTFALDSARRVGEEVRLERERRTNWRLSLRLDWLPGRRAAGPR